MVKVTEESVHLWEKLIPYLPCAPHKVIALYGNSNQAKKIFLYQINIEEIYRDELEDEPCINHDATKKSVVSFTKEKRTESQISIGSEENNQLDMQQSVIIPVRNIKQDKELEYDTKASQVSVLKYLIPLVLIVLLLIYWIDKQTEISPQQQASPGKVGSIEYVEKNSNHSKVNPTYTEVTQTTPDNTHELVQILKNQEESQPNLKNQLEKRVHAKQQEDEIIKLKSILEDRIKQDKVNELEKQKLLNELKDKQKLLDKYQEPAIEQIQDEQKQEKPKKNWKKDRVINVGNQIDSTYEAIGGISQDETLPVKLNNTWGLVNISGKVLITPKYDEMYPMSDGWSVIKKHEGKWNFINIDGDFLKPNYDFDKTESFHNGLAAIRSNDSWGVINTKGEIVIRPRYKAIKYFSEGLAPVKIGDNWGYIDKTGILKIRPRFKQAYPFSEGLAIVVNNVNRRGFIDTNGQFVISPDYDSAGRFSESMSVVKKHGKWGYIDREGKPLNITTPFQYDSATGFSEGLAPVKIGSKWGYIDRNNQIVIEPEFEKAYQFHDGYAIVITDGLRGYIDKFGHYVVSPQYETAYKHVKGLMPVQKEGKWGVLRINQKYGNEYILPNSQIEGLVASDINELNSLELRMAEAEILARHGLIFKHPYYSSYFRKLEWYSGEINDLDSSLLSTIERQNINLLKKEQERKGAVSVKYGL